MRQRYIWMRLGVMLLVGHLSLTTVSSQSVRDIISSDPGYASCNYYIYPDKVVSKMTPAPRGRHPFYISHYGRHGSRYISNRTGFDIPYRMMLQADSLDELTPMGKRVLEEMRLIMDDTEDRWGELTGYGRAQHELIAHRMVQRFPEVFIDDAKVSAMSTVVPRCIISMGAAVQEMAQMNPKLQVTMEASKRTMWYMNHQDPVLRKNAMSPAAKAAYEAYVDKRRSSRRLMELLFYNPDVVAEFVDATQFNYFLMKMGLFQLNTPLYKNTYLIDIFTTDELYQLWQKDNAWWYVQHGACKLNGGRQPYSQRHLLRQIIADADSCFCLERPGAQLRFGHETVLLPLACLLGINGYDLAISDLEKLESRGWRCSSVFPMGSNIQFIFYRRNPKDKDVLFKVLLNEQEATLPIWTDSAPYYRWADFRRYYLKKLDKYEKDNVRHE